MRPSVLILIGALACAWPALAKAPVIVELYTSQGCGSCTAAGQLVDQLSARGDLLPLTFSVDYWDYLGWTDTFAKPEFSDRQRRYGAHWPKQTIYTPQVVVAGRGQARADETKAVERLIAHAQAAPASGPKIRFAHDRVVLGAGAAPVKPADVWLIRYDPRSQNVEVRRGENAGRTLTYRNVVRELVDLGSWSGHAVSYGLPQAREEGLTSLVVVQKADGGEVLASHVL